MKTTILTLALVSASTLGLRADQAPLATAFEAPALAPPSWNAQDPADSLWRTAREAMNRGEHVRAADLYRQIWERHARSTYAADAFYWEAFNRYRTNETRDLERALESLELQGQRHANAATRQSGEAAGLATRVRGLLARRGDARSAEALVAAANEVAAAGTAMAGRGTALAEVEGVMAEQGRIMAEQGRAMAEQGAVIAARHGSRGGVQDVPQECRDQLETQVAALNALIHMNSERALPVLKQVMTRRDACSPPLRRRAVFLIADKRSSETVDILLDAARNDPDLEVRRQAVFWLSEVDDERAVDALSGFLRESDDEQIRERAVMALAQHDSPRARQILRDVAQDPAMPATLRGRAVFWLGNEGTAEDIAFIRGLFGQTGDASIDERILMAVAQRESAENAQWLLEIGANAQHSLEVRRKAVFWAGEAGAPAAQLGALYDRLPDREMKERLLFVLSNSDETGALDKLIQIARTETDKELRKKAIFWLGNSNDPRAADVLMELITNPGGGG